tara:strand:+ start:83 stop:361 length:279 start_codon:yes stop_codon:yes gene_type:complete
VKYLENENKPISNTTCFNEHDRLNVSCQKKDCKYWMNSSEDMNCVLISSSRGKKTLQEIGDIFGITRMRICQIEKSILGKLSKKRSFHTIEK